MVVFRIFFTKTYDHFCAICTKELLRASTSNYIMFNNKKYTYVDESIEEGYIKYSLLDYENNDVVIKVIAVTMNTFTIL